MPAATLPLIALLDETVLPDEERTFAPPVLDVAVLDALAQTPGETVLVVGVGSLAEAPSLVGGRWATECAVVSVASDGLRLRGLSRARIVTARGARPPFTAEVDRPAEAPPAAQTTALVEGAFAVLAALRAGLVPEVPDWAARIREPLAGLARALTPRGELREALAVTPADALAKLAKRIGSGAPAEGAAAALEDVLRALTAKAQPSRAQRHALWSQVVAIQKRLDVYDPAVGTDEGDELGQLQRRLMQAGLPRAARDAVKRELRLLRGMPTNHHDYSTHVRYLDTVARLAWQPDVLPAPDLAAVRASLDREHAGLERAKNRVLEYLAVRALGGSGGSTVLCLVGPPGVGKTTLARAIASALGRRYVRVPLGGVHDESEIRGHRISFTSAGPGRIVAGFARAGTSTPVVLLDEIDKLGTDTQRSPYAALLEVLDPEQHAQFQDNYLSIPFDLSHALFICTANDLGGIDPTLLDRLEPVELEGYAVREKLAIARAHILPRLREQHGLPGDLGFDDATLGLVIDGYTREAGVRQLQRALASLHRARALVFATGHDEALARREVTADEVHAVLGARKFTRAALETTLPPGVATGLSVGPDGGAPLFIEVGVMPGRGELRTTGRLGEVMRESAQAALGYLRIDPGAYGIAPERLACDVHVHVPDGATAKDGPSAGVAVFVALVSALRRVPVHADVALTGEITLHGRVLPVGGVRAKLLAAERAGARRVVLPADNLGDVPEGLRLEVVAVREAREALAAALDESPEEKR